MVLVMLALVSAVCDGNIIRHLQAERDFSNLMFAYSHQNYALYCTYQHLNLVNLKETDNPAFKTLIEHGFGDSISGRAFSFIHGALLTELFSRGTKTTARPIQIRVQYR